MKINKSLLAGCAAFALMSTIGCRNDDFNSDIPQYSYTDGYFITNEGNFGTPNASVTYVSEDLGKVQQGIYNKENHEKAGDVLQSMYLEDKAAFLVFNNSNSVKIVNRYNFIKIGEITEGLNSPRYATTLDNYLYVTNDKYQGDTYVNVYDLTSLSLQAHIPMPQDAEYIVTAGNNVFVQNASFGFGNKISLIDGATKNITSEITLPNGQLQKIVEEDDIVYALASDTSANSYLYTLSASGNITATLTLTGISGAKNLVIDDNTLYFTSGLDIYSMPLGSTTVPNAPLFTATESQQYSGLYGFNVIDGKIFTSDANGFSAPSTVTVYSPSGNILKTFEAGIGANGFYEN